MIDAWSNSDKTPYVSNSLSAQYFYSEIPEGTNYSIPKDGFYILMCYNEDPNGTRSASISVSNCPILSNTANIAAYICVPLKKDTVIYTRPAVTAIDKFKYFLVSSFT